MNRRSFLKGIAGIGVGLILPPEPEKRFWALDRTMVASVHESYEEWWRWEVETRYPLPDESLGELFNLARTRFQFHVKAHPELQIPEFMRYMEDQFDSLS